MKFTLGLVIGASVGAAIVHYLNTPEGKALVNKVKKDADEVSENVTGLAEDIVQKTKSIIGKREDESDEGTLIMVVESQSQPDYANSGKYQ
jgi:gas vesicle protein